MRDSSASKPSRRYGDKRPDSEIGREIIQLAELKKKLTIIGGKYHIALGMQWALEWVTQRGSAPTHKLKSLSKGETAEHLARAHDQILKAIDALMVENGDQLFGADQPRKHGRVRDK